MLRGLALLILAALALSVVTVFALRWIDPSTTAFMVRDRMVAAGKPDKSYRFRHRWVDWKAISPHAKVAVIAAEDQTFPDHRGFDFKSINKAIEERERGRWVRKGLEVYFTLLIETLWPKQRILEVYLNVAEFGKGVFGVGAASETYFRKPAARLNAYDAALLAAVLPSPKRMRVNAPSNYMRSRQNWIVGQMRRMGGEQMLRELNE
jgi:monofunctional biosynthetic peptidoglycan transglycosylase